MPAERLLPTSEGADIVALARDFATAELARGRRRPRRTAAFPRELFRELGRLGFLGMPYPEE